MDYSELSRIETDLLLEGMFQRYGYDFRSYARASVERRIRNFLSATGHKNISDLIPLMLHDEAFFSELAQQFSISVTEMFRDPLFYRSVRENVLPLLRTYPFFKVWHAGCATGEEVYSLAILLQEEGLYRRATIYATDFNDSSLAQAKEGIFPLNKIQEFTKNHQQTNSKTSLSDYYHAKYENAVFDNSLKERMTFANHNLAVDNAFGEMHLIFCRNVLIYFNRDLQNRALKLFAESLVHGGFLCLGSKETLRFSEVSDVFEEVDEKARIFQKRQ